MTWHAPEPPPVLVRTLAGRVRSGLRVAALALLLLCGVVVYLTLRLLERPFARAGRPLSTPLAQVVLRVALRIMRLSVVVAGHPLRGPGALVANHASWLDILVLKSVVPVFFVSKAEVATWPGIGALARMMGTVFIRRDPREAATQRAIFETRLRAGHRLLFFPEGTSSDAQRVLPFKSTLFDAFFTPGLRDLLQVQPVTLAYHPAADLDPRALAWWGDMAFAPHFLGILGVPRAGRVIVTFHAPIPVATMPDRKALARACEAAVRAGFEATHPAVPSAKSAPNAARARGCVAQTDGL